MNLHVSLPLVASADAPSQLPWHRQLGWDNTSSGKRKCFAPASKLNRYHRWNHAHRDAKCQWAACTCCMQFVSMNKQDSPILRADSTTLPTLAVNLRCQVSATSMWRVQRNTTHPSYRFVSAAFSSDSALFLFSFSKVRSARARSVADISQDSIKVRTVSWLAICAGSRKIFTVLGWPAFFNL